MGTKNCILSDSVRNTCEEIRRNEKKFDKMKKVGSLGNVGKSKTENSSEFIKTLV